MAKPISHYPIACYTYLACVGLCETTYGSLLAQYITSRDHMACIEIRIVNITDRVAYSKKDCEKLFYPVHEPNIFLSLAKSSQFLLFITKWHEYRWLNSLLQLYCGKSQTIVTIMKGEMEGLWVCISTAFCRNHLFLPEKISVTIKGLETLHLERYLQLAHTFTKSS